MTFDANEAVPADEPGLRERVIVYCRNNIFFFASLAAALAVSCMLISEVQETRNVNIEINNEYAQQDRLYQEYQHLRLEQQTLAEYSHIRDVAKRSLNMTEPAVDSRRVVDLRKAAVTGDE